VSLRVAARHLARSPGLSALIVATLGVGIGSNVALFGVLRAVLLEPLPYPEADRLVRIWETNPDVDDERHGPSPWNVSDWDVRAEGFEHMAAWYLTSGTYRGEDWAEEVRSAQVTVDFFRTLGVQPLLGRDFLPQEVERYGPVMLSHRLWLRRFGGDPAVVGTTVVSSTNRYRIVGVMPPDFAFPDESVEAWIAWNLPNVYADRPESRTWRFLGGVARLEADVSVAEAEDELDRVAAGLASEHPDMNGGWDAAVTSLHEELVGDVRGTVWLAFGAVACILLIACANVANLLLARVPARVGSIRIRTTLGATRGRIARELLAESLLLGAVSGLLGLALGAVLIDLLVAIDAGGIPRLAEVSIDLGVFAFTVLVALATSLAFGLAPMLQILRSSAGGGDGLRVAGSVAQRRLVGGFVGSQIARWCSSPAPGSSPSPCVDSARSTRASTPSASPRDDGRGALPLRAARGLRGDRARAGEHRRVRRDRLCREPSSA
jgi:predicted permease